MTPDKSKDEFQRRMEQLKEIDINRRKLELFDEMLDACKTAFERLKPKGNVTKDFEGHVAVAALSKVIHKATELEKKP